MSDLAILSIIISATIILSIIIYLLIGMFFYGLSVKRKALIGKIVLKYIDSRMSEYRIDRKWWDTQKIERLEINSGKENLVGFLIRNDKKTNKVAIIIHGYYVSHKDVNSQSEIFLKHGFNVFAPDLRAHGESSGKTIGMGSFDKDDVVLWINKMIEIFGKDAEIVLFGISMGGATVCLVSGEKLPTNVKCIVSDCAYDNLYDQFKYILKEKVNLPQFPIINIASRFIKFFGKYNLKDVNPRAAVEKSNLPILFIHGSVDEFVPSYMVKKLYNASNKRKCEIYIVEGASHGKSFPLDPIGYENKMMNFVNKHIK